ncbi:MAG TPA: DUF2203 domain-containing protein [Bacillota bacterium]
MTAPKRLFTVDEANALLPRLERDLTQLQALYRTAKEKYVELKQLKAVGTRPDGRLIMAHDFAQARRDFDRLVRQINRAIDRIHRLGVQVKHIELGLVDFPARVAGREVLLCWRMGEPAVTHYHGADEGYRGRKPLPEGGG